MEDNFSKKEAIHIIWDNFKMRQAHWWQSLNRGTLAIITLWSIPYVKPELFTDLRYFILFFPIVALALFAGATLRRRDILSQPAVPANVRQVILLP